MINIAIKHLVYIAFLGISSLLLTKFDILNKLFALLIPIHFIIQKKIPFGNLDLFLKIKSLLVLISLVFYSYHDMFSIVDIPIIISYMLALNIAEPGIMLGINSKKWLSKINGFCLIILALYTPKLTLKNNIIGYDNNQLWTITYSILLGILYLFNDYFYKSNWKYPGIYALLIPISLSLYMNNSRIWLPLRLYSLVITWLIMTNYPDIHRTISSYLNNTYALTNNNYDLYKSLSVIIGIFATIKVVLQGKTNTILDF
tara:strand:+ start:30 stop:803 length:774 start_codon:yes stop_codon:yes gene_type:complete